MEWNNLLFAVILLLALFLIYRYFIRWLEGREHRKEIPLGAISGIMMVLKLLIGISAILVLLWGSGIDTTSLGIIAAIVALTIAFASQQTLGNFIAGIYLIMSHPFHVGDYIKVGTSGKIEGIVREITTNHTKIQTRDEIYFLINNSNLLGEEVLNYRLGQSEPVVFRYPIELDFDYTLSVPQIEEILNGVIERYKGQLSRAPEYFPWTFDDDIMKFIFFIYVTDPEKIFMFRHQIVNDILKAREKVKSQKTKGS